MTMLIRPYYLISPKSYFCASWSLLICLMYAMIDHLMNTYRLIELSHSPTKPPVLMTSASFRASHRIGLAISRYSIRISSIVSNSYGSLFSIIDNLVSSIHKLCEATLSNLIIETSNYWVMNIAFKNRPIRPVSLIAVWLNADYLAFGIARVPKNQTINNNNANFSKLKKLDLWFMFDKVSLLIYTSVNVLVNGRFDLENHHKRSND
jgi:hypothetical protein